MFPAGFQAVLATLGSSIANQLPQSNATIWNTTMSPTPGIVSPLPLSNMSSLLSFILSFNGLGDWLKLFILGGLIESARRLVTTAYTSLLESFLITVHFDGDDIPYSWLVVWLSKQRSWSKARSLQVSSNSLGDTFGAGSGLVIPGEDTRGKGGRPLSILPSWDQTHSIWFRRRLMRVTRSKKYLGDARVENSLTVQMYTRSHETIYALLLEAKREHEAETYYRVCVYVCDQFNNWYCAGSRPKRPIDSVVIPEEIKELLIEDAKDFMDSEEWYGQRGIPWQRGWLLYGVPGSGKTSIIQALAGELGIDIYVVSLAKRGLDDTSLSGLINSIPTRSIILMEDIDAAFTTSLNRDAPTQQTFNGLGSTNPSSITLSGLLNAIDGVQAQQGRLLFATTNKYLALDPALVRPGRLDVHIEFKSASKWQAAELFRRFYPSDPASGKNGEAVPKDGTDHNGDVAEKSSEITNSSTDTKVDEVAVESQLSTAVSLARSRRSKPPILSASELDTLAQAFAAAIPKEEISMAALQGHLMLFKSRPHQAVKAAPDFVMRERERMAQVAAVTAQKERGSGNVVAASIAPPTTTTGNGTSIEATVTSTPGSNDNTRVCTPAVTAASVLSTDTTPTVGILNATPFTSN